MKVWECFNEAEQKEEDRPSTAQHILQKKYWLLKADHRASRRTGRGSHCHMCALMVTDNRLKTTTGGSLQSMASISAIGGQHDRRNGVLFIQGGDDRCAAKVFQSARCTTRRLRQPDQHTEALGEAADGR